MVSGSDVWLALRAQHGVASTRIMHRRPARCVPPIVPPQSRAIDDDIARPSPSPCPISFVVKNGSNRRGSTSSGMPGPLSCTANDTLESAVSISIKCAAVSCPRCVERVAEQIDQHLFEPQFVAIARSVRGGRQRDSAAYATSPSLSSNANSSSTLCKRFCNNATTLRSARMIGARAPRGRARPTNSFN